MEEQEGEEWMRKIGAREKRHRRRQGKRKRKPEVGKKRRKGTWEELPPLSSWLLHVLFGSSAVGRCSQDLCGGTSS